MTEIPARSVTVKNGEWTCNDCGGELGAFSGPRGPGWHLSIPHTCKHVDTCAERMRKLLP